MSCYITFGGYRNRKRLTRSVIEWFIHNRKLSRFQTFVHVIDRNLKREGMYGCIHSIDQLSRPRFFEIEMDNQQDDTSYGPHYYMNWCTLNNGYVVNGNSNGRKIRFRIYGTVESFLTLQSMTMNHGKWKHMHWNATTTRNTKNATNH